MTLETAQIWLGLGITIVGAFVSHFASYRFYVWKLKSVFRKVNEIEKIISEHEREFLPKGDFHRSFDDLRGDIKDLRNQIHALVVGLSAR